ncbi:SulP family inorganic anion transporter [Xanthobacter sp. KR7-225]|uniref:SulP family inorganic anion transporter n=1 Tax=Xanthobacter sp. KR7-225 TaxID=3156613 RepID=UPI0032B52C25
MTPHPNLARWAPGLAALLAYRRADLLPDLKAGLAVAAVAVPVGIAYAGLAGFGPQIGLYSCLFPLVAYGLFGSSRQLILGPDAATCAVIAASVAPLAAGDPALYASLSGMLALLAGLVCVAASFLRLGALADFLSKPILVGFLNGVALTIIIGQLAKVFGIPLQAEGVLSTLLDLAMRLGETHLPTLLVALGAVAVFLLGQRFLPAVPAAVSAMAASALAVAVLSLDARGVRTLGAVPAGLPGLAFPRVDPALLPQLFAEAAGLALVSFSSLMLTARSFASKNRYEVDADQDFAALGLANMVSAVTHGFAVSGADSRTAMADAAGGRTHATGLFAALAVGLVLLFLTEPLRYVPVAALGAVLVFAGLSLVDLRTLALIWRADRAEAAISVLATAGVVAFGAIQGILVAVLLAVLRFVRISARPRVEILGRIEGLPGFHSLDRHKDGVAPAGVLIFRFNGPIVFFNAGHFRHALLKAADGEGERVETVILDLLPVTDVDVTGLFALKEVKEALAASGIVLAAAGRQTEWLQWLDRHGFPRDALPLYPTLRQAVKACRPRPLSREAQA